MEVDYTSEELKTTFEEYGKLVDGGKTLRQTISHPYLSKDNARNLKEKVGVFRESMPSSLVDLLDDRLKKFEKEADSVLNCKRGLFVSPEPRKGLKAYI